MTILLAFAPFFLFAIVERFAGVSAGLLWGAAASLLLIARDVLSPNRKVKVLEIGTAVLFAGLAIFHLLAGGAWSMIGVRLMVDLGLLLIVLVSLAIRMPFTLQYAREQVASEHWSSPEFVHVNYSITLVWATAFLIMVAVDLVMLYAPAIPLRAGIWITVLTITGAAKFTQWYPEREQAKA